MAKVDAAYEYYLSAYGKTPQTRYDAHKKSELRNVYNSIVKANKESPLYKIIQSGNATEFAIDMKEGARGIQSTISSIIGKNGDIEDTFNKRVAVSSNRDVLDAEYLIDDEDSDSPAPKGFSMEVRALAQPQVTTGNYLEHDGHLFRPGSYSFDLNTDSNSYEFQFNVNEGDTNKEVQDKIARLVNTAKVGVTAEVLENSRGQSALQLTSVKTGLQEDEEFLFSIQSGSSYSAIKALGIDEITSPASNSEFLLNGHQHSSLTNNFTINNMFEVTLKGISAPGEAAQVSFKANAEAIADNVVSLADSYNNMVSVGMKYSDQSGSGVLHREITNLAYKQQSSLEDIGFHLEDDGFMSIDREKLATAIDDPETANETFASLNRFKDSLGAFARRTSINPMAYVNKLIVAYKNPGKTYGAPYAPSNYSGMLIDGYC